MNLVYYCLVNNSLLILNDGDYSVQSSIKVSMTGRFDEVKVSSDGLAVAVVAIGSSIGSGPTPSRLIRFDLQTKQIINQITFDHDLAPGETITRYATSSKGSYVLAVSKQGSSLTVYSLNMIGSSYQLQAFYRTGLSLTQVVNELFTVGDYVVVSFDYNFSILNKQGGVVQSYSNLQSKSNGGNKDLPVYVALAADVGTQDFYALLSNQNLIKFSVKITGVVHEIVSSTALDMWLVTSDLTRGTLLSIITSEFEEFTITDLKTNQKVYQFTPGFNNFMMTDSSYVAYKVNQTSRYGSKFSIFTRDGDQMWLISDTGSQVKYYHNQEQQMVSYFGPSKAGTCQVYQLNLTSGTLSSYLVIKDVSACQGEILHAMNIDMKTLQVTIAHKNGNADVYTIVSQAFGEVKFVPKSNSGDVKTLVANYDTLSLYHFVQSIQYQNTTVYEYTYQGSQFNLANTVLFDNVAASKYVILNQNQVAAFIFQNFTVIDIPTFSSKNYQYFSYWDSVSSFKDQSGKTIMILSNAADTTLFNKGAGIIDANGNQALLPGSSNNTISAGPAGPCKYWLVNYDQFVPTVAMVQFYDICAQSIAIPVQIDI